MDHDGNDKLLIDKRGPVRGLAPHGGRGMEGVAFRMWSDLIAPEAPKGRHDER